MKQDLHPNWHDDCVVTCSCGNTFITGATTKTMQVDICSACHPFFTGEMKFVDRQGRVDKFMQKMKLAQQKKAAAQKQKTKKQTQSTQDPKSYQQILREQKTKLRQTKAAQVTPAQ